MKNKLKILFIVIILIIVVGIISAVGLIIYMFKGDVKAKLPEKVEKELATTEMEINSRKVYILKPEQGVKNDLTVIYTHGGSYVSDLNEQHWELCKDIVNRFNCTVIIPDYPLTPKYNYKDTYEMMGKLYKQVVENVDPKNLVLMGDSAGGGLSLGLAEKMTSEENLPAPNQIILISPWLDVRMQNPKIDEIAKNDPMLSKAALKLAGQNYAGEDGINSYQVNPVYGPLEKLKNISVFTGTRDMLNADVPILQKNANEKNVNINIFQYEGATHVWLLYRYKDKKNTELVQKPYAEMMELLEKNSEKS